MISAATLTLILKMIDIVSTAVTLAPEIKGRYDKLADLVGTMVRENRDPTDEEWAALDLESDELLARLRD